MAGLNSCVRAQPASRTSEYETPAVRRPSLTGVARRPEGEMTQAGGSLAMSNTDSLRGAAGVSWWAFVVGVYMRTGWTPCGKRWQARATEIERHRRTETPIGRRVGKIVNRAKRLRQRGDFREVRSGMALVELGLLSDTRRCGALRLSRRNMETILWEPRERDGITLQQGDS
jgi:hypothetical protein